MTTQSTPIRRLDPRVLAQLKARAQKHGRSLDAEIQLILQQSVSANPSIRAIMERTRSLFAGRYFTDSAEMIRQDRER